MVDQSLSPTRPWIGNAWGAPDNWIGGVKLLVLGMSAHDSSYDDGEVLTRQYFVDKLGNALPKDYFVSTVERFIAYNDNWRLYKVITGLLAGKSASAVSAAERYAIWNSVAFFNYVPGIAASYSRQRVPPPEMLRAGAACFDKFVGEHAPQAVLVCGISHTWHWLLKGMGYRGEPWRLSFYETPSTVMIPIQHPSTAFSYAKWRPVLDFLLREAKARFIEKTKVPCQTVDWAEVGVFDTIEEATARAVEELRAAGFGSANIHQMHDDFVVMIYADEEAGKIKARDLTARDGGQ
jgi:hypothetical protein